MKVAVLGAAGTIAPAIVRDLAESEEVESILLLDLAARSPSASRPSMAAARRRARRPTPASGLAGRLEGVDVLVNSASYRINLDAMRACLEAGVPLPRPRRPLPRHRRAARACTASSRRAGLLAILGIGSSPGKTNLMAAQAVAELGGRGGRGST